MRFERWFYTFPLKMRTLFRRKQVEHELDEEVRYHIEQQVAEHIASGMTPDEARMAADRAFGGVARHKEAARDERRLNVIDHLFKDLHYTVRSFLKNPGFTVVVILTLAMGIGANSAIFSVVNGVLLKPLPYHDPHELVAVWSRYLPESGLDLPEVPVAVGEYVDYRENNRSMEDVASYYAPPSPVARTLTGPEGGAERAPVVFSTWNLFPLLGVRPSLGRWFTREDDVPGAAAVVILGHGLWSRRYGSDPSIIGKLVTVGGLEREVVGVMPESFGFPRPDTVIWAPSKLNEAGGDRGSHDFEVVARLKDGVTLEDAQAEMTTMMAAWKVEFPTIHSGHFLFMRDLRDDRVGDFERALFLLLGAVGFVFLVVCANVANLILVRAQARRKEESLMRALGASGWRTFQRGLVEGLVLVSAGGLFGVGLSYYGVRALLTMGGTDLPRQSEIGLDGTVMLFAGALTSLAVLFLAIFPAWHRNRRESFEALREGGGRGTTTRGALYTRRILVVAQVALSLVLVLGAGLMVKSFAKLLQADSGFRAKGILTAGLDLEAASYPKSEDAVRFYTQLFDRLHSLPGVSSASGTRYLPLASQHSTNTFELDQLVPPAPGEPGWNARFNPVWAGYFETMGIPVNEGRGFEETDDASAVPAAVVSRSLAERWLQDVEPVGKRIRFFGDPVWFTIVGVAEDVKYEGLDGEVEPTWYVSNKQASLSNSFDGRDMTLVLGTTLEPGLLAEGLRAAVRELDPNLPVYSLQTMTAAASASVARPRFLMTVMGVFAFVALFLGGVGIYGVAAFVVVQRSHEIGIRRALGAARGDLSGLVIRQGMIPVLFGLGLGLASAIASSNVMESLLFEVSPLDVATYVAVTAILGSVAFLACALPAIRAVRIDPMKVLRTE